ncbi:homogentisate 1,2-dioxygenase [Sphingosinicella soli]|uniref:Homogentisate 1,2-dioxygenase n=1 Tax=Sphingosinicella soli TaxID=333708 RepID=A0A7W7F746_9SPHN|nr:homogentisate 1,2-dioxygenase [Sphingosinicella soli]MBB4632242.1 hypothetical protein [Sphingosinicella soli]
MARFTMAWAAGVGFLIAGPALAQTHCPTDAAPLPPELATWSAAPAPLSKDAALTAGIPARAALKPTSEVTFTSAPERETKPDSFGGVLRFETPEAGTWRVSLGAGGWIDVLSGGKPVASIAHGHGPACSGIRKIVDFALPAGTYVLQISNAATNSIDVMVARAP